MYKKEVRRFYSYKLIYTLIINEYISNKMLYRLKPPTNIKNSVFMIYLLNSVLIV